MGENKIGFEEYLNKVSEIHTLGKLKMTEFNGIEALIGNHEGMEIVVTAERSSIPRRGYEYHALGVHNGELIYEHSDHGSFIPNRIWVRSIPQLFEYYKRELKEEEKALQERIKTYIQ